MRSQHNNNKRDLIRKINADKSLSRIEKTRKIQKLLCNHISNKKVISPKKSDKNNNKTFSLSNNIIDTIKGIVHCSKKSESRFVAAGVKMVPGVPSNRPKDEFCIFSRELLRNSTPGAIVVSTTTKGQLEWKFLCQPSIKLSDKNLKGIHLFDIEYLTEYVKREGAEYVKCPLCRQGANTKKKVEEYEIETLGSLKDRRDAAEKNGDTQMVFFTETLMLLKTMSEKWNPEEQADRFKVNKECVKKILTHWSRRWSYNEYIAPIKNAVAKTLQKDNSDMLETLLDEIFKPCYNYSQSHKDSFLTEAAGYGAVDCVKLLLDRGAKQNYEAPALQAAIETRNQHLLDILMQSMVKDGSRFVCGQLFPKVIKYNMVECARQIIESRWHKPTEKI
eukprot:UN06936